MCFGVIAETSMEKMTHPFVSNHEDIGHLRREGEITASYRHGIRKKNNIWQPGYKCAVKYNDMNDPNETTSEVRDLKSITRKYLHPTISTHYGPVRTEAYKTLTDLQQKQEITHPFISQDTTKNVQKQH